MRSHMPSPAAAIPRDERLATLRSVACWLLAVVVPASALGQQASLPPDHHVWGRFPVGSWQSTRQISETLDPQGRVTAVTITDTRTTLVAADDQTYTLKYETTVEVAGKTVAVPMRTVKYCYDDSLAELMAQRAWLPQEQAVRIEDRDVACRVLETRLSSATQRTTIRTFFAADTQPHVLRRETLTTPAAEPVPESRTTLEVVALDMPHHVLDTMRSVAHVRVTHRNGTGSMTRFVYWCLDIPGGVVAHTTKELDAAGKLVRRSTLELVEYFVAEPAVPESGMYCIRGGERRGCLAWLGRRRVVVVTPRTASQALADRSVRSTALHCWFVYRQPR